MADSHLSPYHRKRPVAKDQSLKHIVIAASVGLAMLMAGGLYFAFKDRIEMASLLQSLPSLDSHKSVITSASKSMQKATASVGRIHDSQSRDVEMQELATVTSDFRDLARRAASLPTLTQAEAIELETWAKKNAQQQSASALERNVSAVESRRMIANGEIRSQLNRLAFAIADFAAVTNTAWKPVPRPETPAEEIEYQILMVYRQLWSKLYDVADDREYQSLSDTFSKAERQVATLRSQYERQDMGGTTIRPSSSYAPILATYHVKQAARFRLLEDQFGALDEALAYQNFTKDSEEFLGGSDEKLYQLALKYETQPSFGQLAANIESTDATNPSQETDETAGGFQGRFNEDRIRQENEAKAETDRRIRRSPTEMAMLDEATEKRDAMRREEARHEGISVDELEARKRAERYANSMKSSPESEGISTKEASQDTAASTAEQAFRRRHRDKSITVVRILDAPPASELAIIEEDFRQEFRPDAISVRSFGDEAIVLLVHDGSLDEMGSKLYWGKLISVDSVNRELRIRYTD
ncbi:hypothetical protein [Rubripirellula amarantea]|uniref:hypothetical protein n=1 Tax=Rubripirellula amarantea TaxID=2527999 RepID=UPI0011B409FA|nr:hypothetical protein [Rubripirellula amarantea]